MDAPRAAQLALGAIRLINGAAALVVPEVVERRLGADPESEASPIYPLRMFGIRTVILGAELLVGGEATRLRSARLGRVVHASDTASVALGGLRRQLPPRTAAALTGVSALNTVLAFVGSRNGGRRGFR